MDISELETKWRSLYNELDALTTPPDDFDQPEEWVMPEQDRERADTVEAELETLEGRIETIKRQKAVIAKSQALEPGDSTRTHEAPFHVSMNRDPYDLSTVGLDADLPALRARVETGLERDNVTPDDVKDGAVRTLGRVYGDRKAVAKRYLATGSTLYRSAFTKYIAGNQNLWTDKEREIVARAQSLTDAAGGFAVPFTLDPSIIGTDGLTFNPIRRISRVVQTTTENWNGVTGNSVSFSWDAEASEVSDDSITLAQPSIPVHKLAGFVPFSVEVGMDWASIDSDLRVALQEGRDNAEAAAHITGTGSGEPTGIQTALDGTASELAPATAEAFALADVYAVLNALPARHRQQDPRWVMNIGTANDIRQFDTQGGGNLFWGDLGQGAMDRLLGYPWEEASNADSSTDINPAATEDNFVLYLGNWSRYVIVDRVGMNVELIPHLFATGNNRPSGQRGLYAFMRTGADSVDDNAFRVMSIPTTL